MRKVLACIFLFAAPLLAQSHFEGGAPVGATGPSFEASAGFVYLSMDMPSERVTLTGLDTSGLIRFATRWGVTGGRDLCQHRQRAEHRTQRQFLWCSSWPRVLSGFIQAVRNLRSCSGRRRPRRQRGAGYGDEIPGWVGHSSVVCDRRRSRAVTVWTVCRPHSGGLSADVVCRLNRFGAGPEQSAADFEHCLPVWRKRGGSLSRLRSR